MPGAAEAGSRLDGRREGKLWPLAAAALVGLLLGDSARPPTTQWGARAAVAVIDGYRAVISPLFERTGLIRCRFTPSCSSYGREAFRRFGTLRGLAMAGGRLLRCHPFAKGGHDPVPAGPT